MTSEPPAVIEQLRAAMARFKLRACGSVGSAPRVTGRVWIHGDGRVELGDRVCLDAAGAPIEIYAHEGAAIVIEDDVHIGGGTSIEATASIRVGARARLGGFCKVMDNHLHQINGDRHVRPAPHPVVIEADASLGPRVVVLAGARIPRGARVSAGTVVKRSGRRAEDG